MSGNHGRSAEFMDEIRAKSLAARKVKRDALLEDIEWLLSWRTSPELIMSRLGKSAAAIARAMLEAGRADLAQPFYALEKRARKTEAAA